MNPLPRVIAFWIPDWPVQASLAENPPPSLEPHTHPVALLEGRRVVALSAAARAAGVRVGQREREAQSLCPDLMLAAHVPEVDARRFSAVVSELEKVVPEIEIPRPGLCTMRARGPARYFGDETAAARALLECAEALGYPHARIGVASGAFAAEHAARAAAATREVSTPLDRVHLVSEQATVPFLSSLPVSRACEPELAETLHGLGIHTLGALAALPEHAVRQRFGPAGMRAYRIATGSPRDDAAGTAEIVPRTPPPNLSAAIDLEPPVDDADRLAFACTSLTDRFSAALLAAGLVCTELRIELIDEIGVHHERNWAHPRQFTSGDVRNRVRWQAAALPPDALREAAGIAHVRIVPIAVDRAAAHEPGLWSNEPDARIHHHLQRIQSMLGHEGVVTAELTGGRLSHERVRLVPWGTRASATSRRPRTLREGTWPGGPPTPTPSRVFSPPIGADLHDAEGSSVDIDDADLLTALPRTLGIERSRLPAPIIGWSQPWPIRERWWLRRKARFRLQVVLADGDAWLLLHEAGVWFAEGRYD